MFDGKKLDNQVQEMNILFNQLNPHFKGHVMTQIKQLIRLQNVKDKYPDPQPPEPPVCPLRHF